jgi:pyruvate,orthophosphate dikinase
MGKTCISGCGDLEVKGKTATLAGKPLKEGDWISLDGTAGEVLADKVALVTPNTKEGPFAQIMVWANKFRRLGVRTNADTPKDAANAVGFGAEGIGLCRTEHMFFEGDRIDAVRAMMLSTTEEGRMKALEDIKPYQKKDFKGLFQAMKGMPCTIRLLDPPMHEFVPHEHKEQAELAPKIGQTADWVANRVKSLEESNPMLGHRGVRLGLSYPEIYEAQVEALFDAACEVQAESGLKLEPEVMIPLVGKVDELRIMKDRCIAVADKVLAKKGVKMSYKMGTMIEVPRAALTADQVATEAEFFSFGTNDLTQMGCGFSRDDSGQFLKEYVKMGIYDADPFQVLDQEGVGLLVEMAVQKGRATRPDLKCGICGEHGGEPRSVKFCHRVGLDYVSCSPFRVPIAIVAAGQAAIEEKRAGGPASKGAAASAPKSKL